MLHEENFDKWYKCYRHIQQYQLCELCVYPMEFLQNQS